MSTKAAVKKGMNKGMPVPIRFDRDEEEFLDKVANQTGLKKSEIVRRACRFSLQKFLKREVNILDLIPVVRR